MKKIITLMLAAGLVSTAVFAQDHRHSYDNRYNVNSYQNQYPLYNGYSTYGSNWHRETYSKPLGYDRYDRDRERRMMYRHRRRYYDDYYRSRNGLSLQVVIGKRRTF
jgi:hypothetical protein